MISYPYAISKVLEKRSNDQINSLLTGVHTVKKEVGISLSTNLATSKNSGWFNLPNNKDAKNWAIRPPSECPTIDK